jgi:galactosylceramidase
MDVTRAYLQNYTQSGITKTIYWYLISAFYPVEPYYDITVGVASSPWSGAYTINPALWAYAHITQFAQPGWQFVDNASGALSGGGDYVTLLSPNKGDFSVVADTYGATATQQVTFTLAGLSPASVNVWRSDANAQFQKQAAVPVSNGSFTVSMTQNAIYSITTTSGQTKGVAPTSPAPSAFPFPYYENYDHYGDFVSVGYRPYYHADIAATFELAERPDATGQCLKQIVAQPAQSWAPEPAGPYTIVGDGAWKDYEVSVDASIETTGWASLMGRVSGVGTGYGTGFKAYYLTLDTTGTWGFYIGNGANAANTAETSTSLGTGKAKLATGAWHNMRLVFSGTSIRGLIDGTQVFSITDGTYKSGQVGLGTQTQSGRYTIAYFDNLIVNAVNGASPSPTKFPQDAQNGAGGRGGSNGTGGTSGTGGASGTGGTSGSGGSSATGGTSGSGGASATGGTPGTGGSAATGGTPGTGGTSATGGTPGTGGMVGSGGSVGTGGVSATGGASGAGGSVGSGGASATGTGGAPSGNGAGQTGADSGCSCQVASPGALSENVVSALVLVVAWLLRRRSHTRRRHNFWS